MSSKFVVHKALLLLSLILLGTVQAQDQHVRKERQLKAAAAATDADVKMVANVTPATQPMGMAMSMPMNQMALSAVGGQLVRYPNYPGLIYPGLAPGLAPGLTPGLSTGPLPGLNGIPGLQTNIANNYPSYPDPNLAGQAGGFNPFGTGYGNFGGYPVPQPIYGGNSLMYPNAQLPNGFVPQPSVDNYQNLNSIVNMANVQGLGTANSGLYPAPQPLPVQVNMQGLYPPPGGFLERMNMQAYAPGF
ncbi:hypothetical protein KR032_012299 [Drosophila birchii]|nr:hypothetical protein KR032_012299 [Drosophila birchii]